MEILCNRELLFTNFHGFCMRVALCRALRVQNVGNVEGINECPTIFVEDILLCY